MDEEDDGMTSGEKIKQFRKAKRITQHELGVKCGMLDSAIGRIENSKGIPRNDTLTKIAAALNVPLEELYPDESPNKAAAGRGSAAANFNEALRQYIIQCVEAMDDRKALLELASDVERVMSMLAEEEAKAECDW